MLRSLLYVPAHSERFIAKAHERGADGIILDLEDAVPEADKDSARAGLAGAVQAVGRNGAQVFVRINAGERQRADAEAAAAAKVAGIFIAKTQVADPDRLADLGVPLLAMLEDPGAILDARLIARHRAIVAVTVGGEDLATTLGATPVPEVLRTPKLLAHYATKAEGKLSLGMLRSVADYADLAAVEASAREARLHGFDGASCVHPSIVPILNGAFAPSADEIAWATRVVAAAATASTGAFVVDGRMVDAPIIARARSILGQAK